MKEKIMKLIFLFTLFLSTISIGQTNIIANRSHSGSIDNLVNEQDDFGAIYVPPTDSVILINSTTIIVVQSNWDGTSIHDTISNHFGLPKNKLELQRFKLNYQNTTKFIGFDDLKSIHGTQINYFKQNQISLFVGFLFLSVLLYAFSPLKNRVKA